MAEEPQVKGSLFRMTVTSLREALEQGRTSREELSRWLEPDDFFYLDGAEITAAGWYPANAFRRAGDAVLHVIAGGSLDYYREQGAKAVSGFMGSGAYKGFLASAENHLEKAGEILVGASSVFFNFSKWSFQGDLESGFILEVKEAKLLPESLAYAMVGFFEAFFSQATKRQVSVDWARPNPDTLVVRGGFAGAEATRRGRC